MQKPSFTDTRSRSKHPTSDIFELKRATVIDLRGPRLDGLPTASSGAECELLARMALDHANAGEHVLARRAADDALVAIESISDDSRRATSARAARIAGEVFARLHEAHRAKRAFEIAVRAFDATSDLSQAAAARVGLANALLALHDASARAVLEDAGEIFEDLADHASVAAIDLALRQAEAEFEESPRSFHAASVSPRPAR